MEDARCQAQKYRKPRGASRFSPPRTASPRNAACTGTLIGDVAARAGVSHGLVLFHFKSKRGLLLALLDWLLESTTVLHLGPDILELASPFDQLRAILRQEMNRLSSEPRRIRLTFDYWIAGIRDATIRSKMRTEFARYRAAFKPVAEAAIAAQYPDRRSSGCAAGPRRDCVLLREATRQVAPAHAAGARAHRPAAAVVGGGRELRRQAVHRAVAAAVVETLVAKRDVLWSNVIPTAIEAVGGFLIGNLVAILVATVFVHNKALQESSFRWS